jgi:predicted ATPase
MPGRGGPGLYNRCKVLLQQAADASAQAAEKCFNQAAEMAREQGALSWKLRIALSLARLRVAQGRENEARKILLPVFEQFPEGFGTVDLRAPKAFLDGLPA